MTALSEVALTNVVEMAVPLTLTTEFARKPVPVSVMVLLGSPRVADAGVTAVMATARTLMVVLPFAVA